MRFRLAPRLMILDDLHMLGYKFELSRNFAGFRRLGMQQLLNK